MAKKFVCTPHEPVVQTAQGALRGFILDGTYTFYGVPYAEAERFQAPRPVAPWQGVRDALSYGYVCPLMEQDAPDKEVLVPHRYWPMDEHCQNLNVWTRQPGPGSKAAGHGLAARRRLFGRQRHRARGLRGGPAV